jgi:hypothetical protein
MLGEILRQRILSMLQDPEKDMLADPSADQASGCAWSPVDHKILRGFSGCYAPKRHAKCDIRK